MTQEELNKVIENDSYFQPRKKPSQTDLRFFLREVNHHCPLCGVELHSRAQRKQEQKRFEIAHIYPNRPTIAQYETLYGVERLGTSTEDFANKIALCLNCHPEQDFQTTKEDYMRLLKIKKNLLLKEGLHDALAMLSFEDELAALIESLCSNEYEQWLNQDLNYNPVPVAQKFTRNESLLVAKIQGYINMYYTYILDCFNQWDGKNSFSNRTQYKHNKKRLAQIESQIQELSEDNYLLDVDSAASEEAVAIKKSLSQAKRYRSGIYNRLSTIDESLSYAFPITTSTFSDLEKFFPGANFRLLSDIENFHRKIAEIFLSELREERKKLEDILMEYDEIIDDYKRQLKDLIHNPSLSKIILQQHSSLQAERQRICSENDAYEKTLRLKEAYNESRTRLQDLKQQQFAVLTRSLNSEMEKINDVIYSGLYSAPLLSFSDKSYIFHTPNDTGTGVAYKGLVVYDLAVLRLTALPILGTVQK